MRSFTRQELHDAVRDKRIREVILRHLASGLAKINESLQNLQYKLAGKVWYRTHNLVECIAHLAGKDAAISEDMRIRCLFVLNRLHASTYEYMKLYAGKTLLSCVTGSRIEIRDFVLSILKSWAESSDPNLRYWAVKVLLSLASFPEVPGKNSTDSATS